ncbi:DUF3891 family protein [Virgibacillus ndiopensis]|uniref:DUF3891 family protein n=1 Tax=Virgibacillus ndiopensis TaxID=2004408 RepID=UPI000C06C1D9|nr:DUF3891 family protein [Virgibacillus ndiopensis]
MIIRERQNDFVMIEQDNHAHISGQIITNWKDSLFLGQELKKSVEYATFKHDCGWQPVDKQPFWNDQKKSPYSFMDFPTLSKLVFYKYGIDLVENVDSYAALLCSRHYTQFLIHDTSQEGKKFVQQEESRQQRIIRSIPNFNKKLFEFHYGLLKLGDSLSLYICLNEPGISKENEHHFYKDGIPIPSSLNIFGQRNLQLQWINKETIIMHDFPLRAPTLIKLKQKVISKKDIVDNGLLECYQASPLQEMTIRLIPEENE